MMAQAQDILGRRNCGDAIQGASVFVESGAAFIDAKGERVQEIQTMMGSGAFAGETGLSKAIRACLNHHLSVITAELTLEQACVQCRIDPKDIDETHLEDLVDALKISLDLYLNKAAFQDALAELSMLGSKGQALIAGEAARGAPRIGDWVSFNIDSAHDIIASRNVAMEYAKESGLGQVDAVKVATIVSELTRNISQYAGSGVIKLRKLLGRGGGIEIVAQDNGPGIENIDEILSGRRRSRTGLGLGLPGSKRLATYFDVETSPEKGTTVTVKYEPIRR